MFADSFAPLCPEAAEVQRWSCDRTFTGLNERSSLPQGRVCAGDEKSGLRGLSGSDATLACRRADRGLTPKRRRDAREKADTSA